MEFLNSALNAAVVIAALVIARTWLLGLREEVSTTLKTVRELQVSMTELLGAAGDLLQDSQKLLEGTKLIAGVSSDCNEMLNDLTAASVGKRG